VWWHGWGRQECILNVGRDVWKMDILRAIKRGKKTTIQYTLGCECTELAEDFAQWQELNLQVLLPEAVGTCSAARQKVLLINGLRCLRELLTCSRRKYMCPA
jgi:hypothetical protein